MSVARFFALIRFWIISVLCLPMLGCGNGPATSTSTDPSPTIALAMKLPSGVSSNALALGQTATVQALVRDSNNQPISGVVVTFSNNNEVANLNPSSGKALSNDQGIASIQITGAAISADTLTASATVNAKDIAQTFTYSVSTPSFDLSNLQAGISTLSAGGSTAITVEVIDPSNNNAAYPTRVSVNFSSICSQSNNASIDATATSVITTVGGVTKNIATATYRDQGCSGSDQITATLVIGAQTVNKTVGITIQSAAATSIQFISAMPSSISLKGIGGGEQATLIFKVTDSLGNGIPNTSVNFLLNTTVGGITLSVNNALSQTDGNVQVVVNAGTVSTVVRVTAQLTNNTVIQTQSNQLTISTGLPHQYGFSLAASCPNPEFFDRDNEEITLSVNAADRFGNPVPDNTAISFYTEKGIGVITPSCPTVNGSCSVTLRSGGQRQGLVNDTTTNRKGRGMVLAYAVGEESFDDMNGDGWYSDGDSLSTDLSEAYLDSNENHAFDAGEQYVDFNNNGLFTTGDSKFNGKGCNASNCSAQQTINVSDSNVIIWSGSRLNSDINTIWKNTNGTNAAAVTLTPVGSPLCSAGQSKTVVFAPTDENGNVLPAETTISFEASNGTITSSTSFTVPCALEPISYNVIIESDATLDSGVCTNTKVSGELKATVTLPKSGLIHTVSIPVTD